MRSVVLLLLVVVLAACSNPREEVAKQLANQVLLPAHEQWHASNTALLDSSRAWCADEQALEDLKRVFHETQTAWARLQPLMVGPLAEGNRSWQVQFWPDKRNMVARQTEALLDEFDDLDQQQLDGASVVVQGLTAFEYVLFDDKVAIVDNRERYCPLLVGIAHHQQTLSSEVLDLWQQPGGMLEQLTTFPNDRYANADEALGGILRVQVTGVDTLKKKLGTPMGRHNNGTPQPYQAEAWRSRHSAQNLLASVDGAQGVWERIRTLVGDAQLAGDIDTAYKSVRDKLAGLPAPLMEMVQDKASQPQLQSLYADLDALENLQQTDLARHLGIQIGFNANDGD
ncbi:MULTISPECIES: imelysin family protein [Alcanivorax]|uniref:imelysin family protein n=1 Tax=Alcanivorax TaxID=59753 RepID=UPI0025BEE952|nr:MULTISPECIES: imelysin family protein [Alcanivorax]